MARLHPESTPRGPAAGAPPHRGPGPSAGAVPFEIPRNVVPRPVSQDATPDHPHLLFNRDLSWLDFNWRVIAQSVLERTPLLERVRFLSIAESNLDRFVRTRLGSLERERAAGIIELSPDGRTPGEQIRLVREAVSRMQARISALWRDELTPRLASLGVEVVGYDALTATERARADRHFRERVYPVVTPLAVDAGHPFPFIPDQSLSIALQTRRPGSTGWGFTCIEVPAARGRWVPLDTTVRRVLPLEALIVQHADSLLPGLELGPARMFRVTRSADIDAGERETEDLIDTIADELRERRFAPVVRLEVESGMSEDVLRLLCRELKVRRGDIVEVEGLLGLGDLMGLADLDLPEHRYPVWEPRIPPVLEGVASGTTDVFRALRERDLLIHHPYESFSASVLRFVEAAAADPDVLAIKQTLYRTGEDSPMVRALIRAADAGKEVAALVEITASFDEQRNIEWARALESHGVHVIHGVRGLKTHAKVTLVIRQEADELVTYSHIGTGNYHVHTARLYTDLGLLTADPVIGSDLVDLFHHITGHAPGHEYEEIIVAPRRMRERFEALIEREIAHQVAGRPARIVAKMNALDDLGIIRELYRASRVGVPIDLIVRGHCRLRPDVPGHSETIRVLSIIGRFLEHDRVYRFENGGAPERFIGSADWRRRNMEERVEVLTPVRDEAAAARLDAILETALADNVTAWDLGPNGEYVLRHPNPEEGPRGFQDLLMRPPAARGSSPRLRARSGRG